MLGMADNQYKFDMKSSSSVAFTSVINAIFAAKSAQDLSNMWLNDFQPHSVF
jgi:hypothetical protein